MTTEKEKILKEYPDYPDLSTKDLFEVMDKCFEAEKSKAIKQVLEQIEFFENNSDFHCPEQLKSKIEELANQSLVSKHSRKDEGNKVKSVSPCEDSQVRYAESAESVCKRDIGESTSKVQEDNRDNRDGLQANKLKVALAK